MIILSIADIEKKTGKKVRKNCMVIGFDTAERHTGICILVVDSAEVSIKSLEKINSNPKEDTVNRMEYFISALMKFKQELPKKSEYRIVIIEDTWFDKNPETLKHLTRFGTIVYLAFRKDCDYKCFMAPSSARARVGFNKKTEIELSGIKANVISRGKNKGKEKAIDIKECIRAYLYRVFDLTIADDDEADAFVLALAGVLL